ncbi:hypothetical protein [Arthrobacter sp. D1-17]
MGRRHVCHDAGDPDGLSSTARDAIEAHLTIVFTTLAVSRTVQNRTGRAVANVIKQLRPLRSATIAIVKMVERSDGGKLAVNLTWLISLVREFWGRGSR